MLKKIYGYKWYYASESWNILSVKTWAKLKLQKINSWYLLAHLKEWWIRKAKTVHRIIAETFIPNPHNKPQVNHKDWNKLNNSISNLEWCTPRENVNHSFKILWRTTVFQTNHPYKWKFWNHLSKKIIQIDKLWNKLNEFPSIMDASRKLLIWHESISKVCLWKQNHTHWFIFKFKNENI